MEKRQEQSKLSTTSHQELIKNSTKLKDSVASEIATQLDKVSAYIDAPPLTQVQKVSVIDFLISEFGTIPVEELGKAVKMVLAEKLETSKDVAYIPKQSVGWWGTILSAWQKYRREIKKRPEPIDLSKPMIEQFTGTEGKNDRYYQLLDDWYKKNGEMPEYGWPYKYARAHAESEGILNVEADDRDEVYQIARDYKKGKKVEQNHLDYAVMSIHFKRKYP